MPDPSSLAPGDPAPPFSALAVGGEHGDAGRRVSLDDFKGENVVLYFYPRDDTPGCTTQACGLRDAWDEIGRMARVFGVSVDDEASHRAFIAKHALPFPLLADTDQRMVSDYGVWVEKTMAGKTFMGAERSTFVIGPAGRLRAVLRRVKPDEHVELLKKALKQEGDA